MLDTNVPISIMRGRETTVASHFSELQAGDSCISVVVYGELMHGVEKSSQSEHTLQLVLAILKDIPVLPLTIEAARLFGYLSAYLERGGQIIGTNDLWIAAHALTENLTLITSNEKEFRRIPGLKVENWAQ
jgi:tRNA(fMet)-specific endonuclease VapC